MERALFHAERGRGLTSPNPIVGAVVVDADGVLAGQGAHLGAGGPHAEIVALDRAGARAHGGSLYCTLEPCSHVGRTGPCVERIHAAGIRRVVVAAGDRNPKVGGRGCEYLRAHDVEVVAGIGKEAAERQLAPFFTWVTSARPFVICKVATSRDGYVGQTGRRVALTGQAADRFFHRQRAEVDAIAVGSETVLSDDPQLTARGAYRFRPLTRVIFDWRARVSAEARVLATVDAGPVIMVIGEAAARREPARLASLSARGAELHVAPERRIEPVLSWLAGRDVMTLLVEGGPRLHAAFAEAGTIDRVQWVVTPHELGSGTAAAAISPAAFGATGSHVHLGDDELIEFDVNRTG